jgi:hypothetical protein
MYGFGESISTVFWAMIFLIVCGFASCSYFAAESIDKDDVIPALGNSIENMENLKRDCEKSLPRDKVCVMVFDYVEVTNDYEQ